MARRAWTGLLITHTRLTRDLDADLRAAHGLSLGDFDVLRTLSSAAGREMRMSRLADAVLFSRSGLTRLVARLEERGLVQRHRPPADVRQVYARITDAGSAALVIAEPTHVAGITARFLAPLDDAALAALGRAWDLVHDSQDTTD